jgi:hypothetical protein
MMFFEVVIDNFRLFFNGDTQKKITDWITSQKPICRRHPINLNNNIKDILQKKDLQQALKIQLSIAYLCDTNNESRSCLFQNATLLNTRCTQISLNDIQNCFRSATTRQPPKQSFNKSIMSSKREEKFKKLQNKQNDQRSSRRKSAPLMSVIKPSHSFPDLSPLKLLNMNEQTTRLLKVTAPKRDFSMHLV